MFPCTHTPGYQPITSPDWSVAGCVLDRGKVRPSDPRVFHHDTGTMSNLPAFIKEIVRRLSFHNILLIFHQKRYLFTYFVFVNFFRT